MSDMSKVEKGQLRVNAIRNGSVIDHIPVEHLFQVVRLLHLDRLTEPITIGQNLRSGKIGRKGIVKVEEKYFCEEELNRLALISPDIVVNIIREYEVVEKKHVTLPEDIIGLVHCPNPKCITNNEPMKSAFRLIDRSEEILQCDYCNRKVHRDEIVLTEE